MKFTHPLRKVRMYGVLLTVAVGLLTLAQVSTKAPRTRRAL